MRRKIYLTTFLMLFCAWSLKSQVFKVDVSNHDTHQMVQGPCYIFATMAALESIALQNDNNCANANNLNFNEWLFYSTDVISNNFSGNAMIEATLNHMVTQGARHLDPAKHPQNEFELPNKVHFSETVANQLSGKAEYINSTGDCSTWTTNHQYYKPSTNSSGNGLGGGTLCEDHDGKFYSMEDNNSNSTFFLKDKDGSDITLGTDPLPWEQVSFANNTSVPDKKQEIANILAGNYDPNRTDEPKRGVIVFFDNWKDPLTSANPVEHAIFIHKIDTNTGLIWYKDSWPSGRGMFGSGPEFIKPNNQGVNIDDRLPFASRLYYITGDVLDTNPPTTGCTNCPGSISGPSLVQSKSKFLLTGVTAPGAINWNVTKGLEIIDGQGTVEITVIPKNCDLAFPVQEVVSVDYNLHCDTDKEVNALRPNQAPNQIILNGPPIGFPGICPGSVIQLEVDDPNYPYPYYQYEWLISGGTIVNGQGSNVINIQTSSASSSQQIYKVRIYDAVCDRYTGYTTLSGTIDDSNCGGGLGNPGGGGPGGGFIGPNAREMDFTDFFEDTPRAKTVQIEIFSMEGRRLLKGEVDANEPIESLKLVPRGIVIIRLYSPETGEFRSFKQLLKE